MIEAAVTRADIVAEARSWIGTPWRHQGRLKGIATDCAGLIIKIPVALGMLPADFDINGYPRTPDPALMQKYLLEFMDKTSDLRGGNALWLKPRHIPQHTAIYTFENTIIHAIDERRGVREHILDDAWRSRIAGIFTYRGLAD